MNEIIEITERYEKFKVLLPIKNILSISCNEDGTAFIETGVDKNGESTGVCTAELYTEIKRKVAKLILLY